MNKANTFHFAQEYYLYSVTLYAMTMKPSTIKYISIFLLFIGLISGSAYCQGKKVPNDSIRGLVVHTRCDYFSQLAYPDDVICGLKIADIGKTSVKYDIGLFKSDEFYCAAQILFIHAYVDSLKRLPVCLPRTLKAALKTIS